MPRGKTHDLIAVLFSVPAFFITLNHTHKPGMAAFFVLAFLIFSYFISPDLDINSKPYQRWGI